MIHTPKIYKSSTPLKSTPKSVKAKPYQLAPLPILDNSQYDDVSAIVDSYIKLGNESTSAKSTKKLEKIKIKKQ